jgi:hypothetical protein
MVERSPGAFFPVQIPGQHQLVDYSPADLVFCNKSKEKVGTMANGIGICMAVYSPSRRCQRICQSQVPVNAFSHYFCDGVVSALEIPGGQEKVYQVFLLLFCGSDVHI